jgi:hypothetical protein
MTTIMPESDRLKQAVRWISAQLKEDETISKQKLINLQSSQRYIISRSTTRHDEKIK